MATADVVPELPDDSNTENGELVVGKKRKRTRRKKLNEEEVLRSEKGIKRLVGGDGKGLSALQSRGKGFELQDLERLLQHYVDWAHMLNPSVDFATVLVQINGLQKGQVVEHFTDLREAAYRRINGVEEDTSGDLNENDDSHVEGETKTGGESKEAQAPQPQTESSEASLSKEERIRRNREAALKRLEEKRLQKSKGGSAGDPAKVDKGEEVSALQHEEDAEIEAMLEAEAKQEKDEDMHEPDMDEMDALDDLLGQQDPEMQPYEPPSATTAGLETMPNENTMESISNAFRRTEDTQSESGISDFESTVSKSTVDNKTKGVLKQTRNTASTIKDSMDSSEAAATEKVESRMTEDNESQRATQEVSHSEVVQNAEALAADERQAYSSQAATQVVNQLESKQSLSESKVDASEHETSATQVVNQGGDKKATEQSAGAASQEQATQLVGQ